MDGLSEGGEAEGGGTVFQAGVVEGAKTPCQEGAWLFEETEKNKIRVRE